MSGEIESTLTCILCNSPMLLSSVTYQGEQRYWCKDCQRKFKNDGSLFMGKVPAKDYPPPCLNIIRECLLTIFGQGLKRKVVITPHSPPSTSG